MICKENKIILILCADIKIEDCGAACCNSVILIFSFFKIESS